MNGRFHGRPAKTLHLINLIALFLTGACLADATYHVGAGQTYSTIQAAVNAIPTDISGEGVQTIMVHRKTGSAPWEYEEPVYLSDAPSRNASEEDYIKITVASGDRHDGTEGTGVALIGHIDARVSYTRIEWLEIKEFDADGGVECGGKNQLVQNLIIHDNDTGYFNNSVGIEVGNDSATATIRNCILYNMAKHGIQVSNPCTASIENVTVYNTDDCGIDVRDNGRASVRNTICMTTSVDDFRTATGGAWITTSHNMSSDNTAPGSDSLHSQDPDSQFVSTSSGSEDLHLKENADAIDAGTTLNGFSHDIDNQNRPSGNEWDMGADEYGGGEPPKSIYDSWTYHTKIYLNTSSSGAGVYSNQYDFPLLVRLDSTNFTFSQAKGNGEDIRFAKSDQWTEMEYHIEQWDSTNAQAAIWVRIDTVLSNNYVQHFYLYWGNANAADSSNSAGVFDTSNNFVSVYHLEDSTDATSNSNDATPHGDVSDTSGGIIGTGGHFDGDGDYFSLPDEGKSDESTVSIWFKSVNDGWNQGLLSHETWDSMYCHFKIYSGVTLNASAYPWPNNLYSDTLDTNTWYHAAYTFEGNGEGNWILYLNGNAVETGDYGFDSTVLPLFLGHEYTTRYFAGILDEARISNTARSGDWIKLCYENQRDTQSVVTLDNPIDEDYTDWPYSQRITFNTTATGGDIDSDVEDFPFLVRLDADNFDFYRAKFDGSDIRFSDPDGTQLPYQIEYWNSSQQKAAIWVKVPRITANSTDDYITMHYGKYGAQDNQSSFTVWDSTFVGVWHMDPASATSDVTDNSPLGNDGVQKNLLSSSIVEAVVGNGLDFEESSSQYVEIPRESEYDLDTAITISAWVKVESFTHNYQAIVTKGDNAWRIQRNGSASTVNLVAKGDVSSSTGINDGEWHYLSGTYDGSKTYIYIDGVKEDSVSTSGNIASGDYKVTIGENAQQTGRYFDGIIDEVRVSGVARSPQWIKLSYENQKIGSKVQMQQDQAYYPAVSGTMANKPNSFDQTDSLISLKYGEDPVNDTIRYALMNVDLSDAHTIDSLGWTLENASLDFSFKDVSTPIESVAIDIGLYSASRFIPSSREDGYKAWLEDASTLDGGSKIQMDDSTYDQGLGGVPDTSDGWSWLLYDIEAEKSRLGITQMLSISGYGGHHESVEGALISVYIKSSSAVSAPSDSAWKNDSAGITTEFEAAYNENNKAIDIDSSELYGKKWLWVAFYSSAQDTNAHGTIGKFKLHARRPKATTMLVYQVKEDDVDFDSLNFTRKSSGTAWEHVAFESDSGDSAEGIGTEDLVSVTPDNNPLWNRYKGKYRSRSPVGSIALDGKYFVGIDSTAFYFGIDSPGRIAASDMLNGYHPFIEDMSTNDSTFFMDSTNHTIGIGGSAKSDSNYSYYPYVVYDMASARNILDFSNILSIQGIVGHQDGSDSIRVFVKTCTTTVQPTDSNWINNTGSVIEWVDNRSWADANAEVMHISHDGHSGDINNIKWVWFGAYSSDGNGSETHGVWANMRINVEVPKVYTASLTSDLLSQALQKTVDDDNENMINFLGVLVDSGSVDFYSVDAEDYLQRPKVTLSFSDSRTLLSWNGRSEALTLSAGGQDSLDFTGNPTKGDGRYGRVMRFHSSGQYAEIKDSANVNYLEGTISFWYQNTSGDADDAEFFSREKDSSFFKLARNDTLWEIFFLYGDTAGDSTGSNQTVWSLIDSFATDTAETAWVYDTIVDPFDGAQHFISFTWDYSNEQFSLTVDSKTLSRKQTLATTTNPISWEADTLILGKNIDGYMEEFSILSLNTGPTGISTKSVSIEDNAGYLPAIQSSFNDTVDCIVISPDDKFFLQELEKYALRNMSMGIRTKVVTTDEIEKYYAGSDFQERLRNFLKQAYLTWNSKWLVLGASDTYIPSREVAFESIADHGVNTDYYYACLEGTWNDDGDKYFAESEDSVDLDAELIVGRFPAMNWSELRSMINRSSMAFSIPPYQAQALGNIDTVMISGVRMFTDIGDVSDGNYYGSILADIIENGAYTDETVVRTYFPSDDFDRDTSIDAVSGYKQTFLDTLLPMPSMWMHYGHGAPAVLLVDNVGAGTNKPVTINTNSILNEEHDFNKFKNMSHVRIVGCETASQEQFSIGRNFIAKDYGGALTYLGAGEYSYPVVESRILEEEVKAFSDSSLFSWGEVNSFALKNVFDIYDGWDIVKWVLFSRDYFGDPIIPVRLTAITEGDTLQIEPEAGEDITVGIDTIEVTITDGNDNPVEGARVGFISQDIKLSIFDTATAAYSFDADNKIAFSYGVTNKKGVVQLAYNVSHEDSVVITATHPDFIAKRIILPVSKTDPNKKLAFETRVFDTGLL